MRHVGCTACGGGLHPPSRAIEAWAHRVAPGAQPALTHALHPPPHVRGRRTPHPFPGARSREHQHKEVQQPSRASMQPPAAAPAALRWPRPRPQGRLAPLSAGGRTTRCTVSSGGASPGPKQASALDIPDPKTHAHWMHPHTQDEASPGGEARTGQVLAGVGLREALLLCRLHHARECQACGRGPGEGRGRGCGRVSPVSDPTPTRVRSRTPPARVTTTASPPADSAQGGRQCR